MVLDTIEMSLLENILEVNEHILWIGKPLAKAFRIRNTRKVLIDFMKLTLFVLAFFTAYYVLLQKEIFPKSDVYSIFLFLLVILLINMISVARKIIHVKEFLYCITDKRILIFNQNKKGKVKIIYKEHIKKKTIINSETDRRYNVQTLQLIVDDEDFYLESMERMEEVLKMI